VAPRIVQVCPATVALQFASLAGAPAWSAG